MLIREARAVDAAGLAKVTVDSWKTTYASIVPAEFLASLSYKKNTPVWRTRLSDSASTWSYYVAEDDKAKIIGFVGGGTERNGNSVYTAELGFIYLLQTYQRKGIGRQLTATLANRLIQQGHHSMMVWTFAANPNRLF